MSKKILFTFLILVVIGVFGVRFLRNSKSSGVSRSTTMEIKSPAFGQNGLIPERYTCDGANVNPPLTISGAPGEAKSFVLIVDDPDAPRGTWVHWTIYNISPQTKAIAERSVPQSAIQGTTSFGKPGYGGPCPPSGMHRYFFKLYALDTVLSAEAALDKTEVENLIRGHILAQTELIGRYGRD